MSRSYMHIQNYEKEIMELRSEVKTGREICELLRISKKQYENFITRYNKKQQKLEAGTVSKHKGRACKNGTELPPSVQQLSKLAQLQYKLAMKERHIKALEMENELMRDFLSLTERK